jgi:hypothetical protein
VDVFDRIMADKISGGLRNALLDFLNKIKLLVEVNDYRTEERGLDLGCVQGSTLGPRLLHCTRVK